MCKNVIPKGWLQKIKNFLDGLKININILKIVQKLLVSKLIKFASQTEYIP